MRLVTDPCLVPVTGVNSPCSNPFQCFLTGATATVRDSVFFFIDPDPLPTVRVLRCRAGVDPSSSSYLLGGVGGRSSLVASSSKRTFCPGCL